MKKSVSLIVLLLFMLNLFGCNKENNSSDSISDLTSYFDSITDDMLEKCNTLPSLESYENDSLVLLNWYNENVRLYGISYETDSAMLLYVNGQKVMINHTYRNTHISYPKLSMNDADNDGQDEIFISRETLTGSPGYWYELLVCDYEETWTVHDYTTYIDDLESYIDCQYNEEDKAITFLRNDNGNIIAEISMPDWTAEYPYTGEINYADYIRFNAETMQMETTPGICFENSMPYCPIKFIFNIIYKNGEFDIELTEVEQ